MGQLSIPQNRLDMLNLPMGIEIKLREGYPFIEDLYKGSFSGVDCGLQSSEMGILQDMLAVCGLPPLP